MDIGAEILKGVDADDRVELVISEGQIVGIRVHCGHPIGHPAASITPLSVCSSTHVRRHDVDVSFSDEKTDVAPFHS